MNKSVHITADVDSENAYGAPLEFRFTHHHHFIIEVFPRSKTEKITRRRKQWAYRVGNHLDSAESLVYAIKAVIHLQKLEASYK